MGLADAQIEANRRARKFAWIETATVISIDSSAPGLVIVNLAGADLELPTMQPVLPNDLVRVARSLEGTPVVLGRALSFPAQGTVAAINAGVSVNVLGDDGHMYEGRPYLLTYTPSVGHLVALDALGRVLGRLSSIAGVPDPSIVPAVPPPPPTPSSGIAYFSADDSGSFQSGRWWTPKVYYSQNNLGAWFYGTKVRDTLAGAVAVDGCQIYLPVEYATGSNAQLGVHPHAAKPGGAPTVSGASAVATNVAAPGWYPLRTDIAQYLIDNAGAGVSTYGAGYRIFSGRSENVDSGRLAIAWRR